jgi:hypothetical protein
MEVVVAIEIALTFVLLFGHFVTVVKERFGRSSA